MSIKEELGALLDAQAPLMHLVTYEEARFLALIEELATDTSRRLGLVSWDSADGFQTHREREEKLPVKECTTDTLLPHLAEKLPSGYIVVLKDFHHSWMQRRPYITRKLRNMAPALRAKKQYLVFMTPPLEASSALPLELKDDVVVVTMPLPGRPELENLFNEVTGQIERSALPPGPVKEKLIASALGLTTTQARLAFARVWAQYRKFDERGIEMMTWAKRQVIRESGALEFWPADEGEADVGGLDLMKAWLTKREAAFGAEAREAGLPFPRGVALIGIPGTGKSLSAKMLSGLWKLPLLRLDVGTLFGSLLGESEANMRKAIMLAETVSPCILWIDEMEKAFAGAETGALTGGAATRVFGAFLTWMQEHQSPVFVVATANDVGGLPPELLARFDRTFFLDLPNPEERRAIFLIHLKKAAVTFPERAFKLDELVEKSEGMVGREIQRAVVEAQFTAFDDGNREIEQEDILTALAETVPINKSHQETMDQLRRWKTEGRAFPASSEPARRTPGQRRVIETPGA